MNNIKKIINSIKEFVNNHTKLCLIIIFIFTVLGYAAVTSKMTTCTYQMIDEELYVNMARSFFYDGNFCKQYALQNYSCVLYSIVISIAYFFYSPERILFLMRIINVILMSSSIFPTYLLTKKVCKNDKVKAILISILGTLVSDMVSVFYVIQENLNYPLFLWIAYFIYLKFESKDKRMIKLDITIVVMLAVIFFVKSYSIAFAAAYFLYQFIDILREKKYKEIKWLFVQGLAFLALIALGMFLIDFANGFQEGTNHYTNQMMSIFPVTLEKIGALLYGIFCYLIFSIFTMGLFTVLLPISNIRNYEEKDRKFIGFLTVTLIITAIESAVIVYIPEEAGKLFPGKICTRYLAPLLIPYIIMFVKSDREKLKISKWVCAVISVIFVYLFIYFIKNNSITFTNIDSYIFAILRFFHERKRLKIDAILIAGIAIVFAFIIYRYKKGKIKNLVRLILIGYTICLIAIMPLNFFLQIDTSNNLTNGEKYMPEYIKMAEYINYKYDRVYAYNMQSRLFYGIINSDYIRFNGNELDMDTKGKKVAIIVEPYMQIELTGGKRVETDTENFILYESDENYDTMHINLK